MNDVRVERIRAALEQQLAPESLSIEDESAAHAGHAGAREGGHFRVHIVSAQFRGRTRLQRHQLVYSALGSLSEQGIHALAIDARAPEELG
jgi:BolA family transcriptional regulator, general stress-responsive regulator